MDNEFVLGRVDIRHAAMIDGEVETVRRNGTAEQMVRRARVRIAEFSVRIAQRAHDVFFIRRRDLHGRQGRAELQTPFWVGEWLGGGASYGSGRAHRARDRNTVPEQHAAIDQTVTGDGILRGRTPYELRIDHDVLPDEGCLAHPALPDRSIC